MLRQKWNNIRSFCIIRQKFKKEYGFQIPFAWKFGYIDGSNKLLKQNFTIGELIQSKRKNGIFQIIVGEVCYIVYFKKHLIENKKPKGKGQKKIEK